MVHLWVYRIHDFSLPMTPRELESSRIGTYKYQGKLGKVGALKSWVARKTGFPPERQVYHCISKVSLPDSSGAYHVDDPRSALPIDYECLRPILVRYKRDGRSYKSGRIAVRFLPETWEAADDDNDDDDIQVVCEANVLEESIARGRANAVEVPESDEDEDGGEGERPPRAKRPRTEAARSGGVEDGEGKSDAEEPGNEGNERGAGKDGEATAPEAVSENLDGAAVQGDGNEHEDGGENEDADGDEEAVGEEHSDGAAAAADGNTALGPDQASPPPGSAIRRWLRDLDATGEGDGGYEAFAPAFEREFRSLRDLALAAEQFGAAEIIAACGVERYGDRACLTWAIGKLERPR